MEEENIMKKLAVAVALCVLSGPAFATCKSEAASKKLAGAALNSFMTKCENDAKSACKTESDKMNLHGAAATSHSNKCVKDKVGT